MAKKGKKAAAAKPAKKAAKKFQSIVKKFPGTRAAERAEKFLDSL